MKNKAKCRITEKIPLHSTDTMLQICHSEGTVSIDRTEIVSEGIRVEGAVYVTVLYLAANDERPMQAAAGVIPLSHVIEAGGITPGSCFTISPMLEQITTMIAPVSACAGTCLLKKRWVPKRPARAARSLNNVRSSIYVILVMTTSPCASLNPQKSAGLLP